MRPTKTGQRVRYTALFLRNTGQFAGPDAPTCSGPWARGEVQVLAKLAEDRAIVRVLWDNGEEFTALDCNLEVWNG